MGQIKIGQQAAAEQDEPTVEATGNLREDTIHSSLVVARNRPAAAIETIVATMAGALPELEHQTEGDASNYAAAAPDIELQTPQARGSPSSDPAATSS